MNILHVYRTCLPVTTGGIEQVIKSISNGVNQLGVSSKILSLDSEERVLNYDGIEVHLFRRDFSVGSNCFSLSLFTKSKELIEWADLLHFHYPWPTGDLISLLASHKPYVITYHSDIVRQRVLKAFYSPLESVFLSRAQKIYVTSKNYLNSSKTLEKYRKKCEVIPLAIEDMTATELSNSEIERVKNRFGSGFFLFVGVLRYYKGLRYLLEAAVSNGLKVIIAGEGPERKTLEQMIRDLNIDNVELIGFIEEADKLALLRLCKAFILPSHLRSEAFGVSLIEAICCGKPVISCEVQTGTSYVNINEETGYVVKPADVDQLSSAMVKLAEEGVAEKLGKNARKWFEEMFTQDLMARKYFESYQAILSSE